uniref:J domain-containing protein n=1 Tax=Strigamia maritima TaxID=126957 RepID=T1JBY4_STRMM
MDAALASNCRTMRMCEVLCTLRMCRAFKIRMGYDYYGILELPRCATDAEIKTAYRRIAVKAHPKKETDPKFHTLFLLINEAYDVLSNLQTKAVYDQFGEEGLKQGIPVGTTPDNYIVNPYIYHGDVNKTFEDFFGGNNPFAECHDVEGFPCFGGIQGKGKKVKDPPIDLELLLTLEELYQGCLKKMRITRRVLEDNGQTTVMRDKILTIGVKPGLPEGSRIIFPEEGDQGPNIIPADVIFTIKDKTHSIYRRQRNDLIYTAVIALGKALTGFILTLPTLDKRVLRIPVVHVVSTDYKKIIEEEGMPIDGSHEKRGNLIIEFVITFPQRLTKDQKEFIQAAQLDK